MNNIKKLIYVLGREIRSIRILYWRLSKGKYLWGIQQNLVDSYSTWWPK